MTEPAVYTPKRFQWCKRPACVRRGVSEHFHHDQWAEYWNSLTPGEQQSLSAKARWEQRTLSAIAVEYGAIESC